jgi:hypothetical protein
MPLHLFAPCDYSTFVRLDALSKRNVLQESSELAFKGLNRSAVALHGQRVVACPQGLPQLTLASLALKLLGHCETCVPVRSSVALLPWSSTAPHGGQTDVDNRRCNRRWSR